MKNDLVIEDLNLTPNLKRLLKEYVLHEYEEHADTTDESLMKEYHYLKDNNKLNDLFIQEKLNNLAKQWQ